MNILYLGYWGANEGLSQSSINSHLEVLLRHDKINRVVYVSIERNNEGEFKIPTGNNLLHVPFYTKGKSRIFQKIFDFTVLPRKLESLIKKEKIDFLICRTALAGGIGHLVHLRTRIPYMVESFEPHAGYMLEVGVWKKRSISYQVATYLEKKLKKTSKFIVTVSNLYYDQLENEGISKERLYNVPCLVDTDIFNFNRQYREEIRLKLRVEANSIVGIYVGKFGDIYYREEAFEIFKRAFDYFKDQFFLILLTPNADVEIAQLFNKVGIDQKKVFVDLVPHIEVVKYLSASDFAFSLIKPTPLRKFCSPIKNGEYWANGLPVLSPEGIGEDSEIIKKESAGAIFSSDFADLEDAFKRIHEMIKGQNHAEYIHEIATKYRGYLIVEEVYASIIEKI